MKQALFFLSLLPSLAFGKLLIMTYQCSYPEFFELQCKALKAFCEDEYDFVMFDDAKNPEYSKAYKKLCQKHGATYYRIDPQIHRYAYQKREPEESFNHPAVRNCNVVEYSLRKIGRNHNDLVFLLDGDLVPVKNFSMREWMDGVDLMGIEQSSQTNARFNNVAHYIWIGFVVLDMRTLPEKSLLNFNCGRANGVSVDAGGHMHYYLKKYKKTIRFKRVFTSILHEKDCRKHDHLKPFSSLAMWNIEQLMNGHFLHFRSGSKWDPKSEKYYETKLNKFQSVIEQRIKATN